MNWRTETPYTNEEPPQEESPQINYKTTNQPNTETLQLQVTTERDFFQHDTAHNLWSMIKLQAMDTGYSFGTRERIPVDFVVVIDTSASMNQNQKLVGVLATLEYMVEILKEWDRFSLVQFNDQAKTLIDLQYMTPDNKIKVRNVLQSIQARGNTNLSDGLFTALDILDAQWKIEDSPINDYRLSRVLLLTDGLANRGLSQTTMLKRLHSRQLPDRLTIHCFGYGEDHSSQVLQAIGFSTPGGLYYFVEGPQSIAGTFGECLAGTFSTIAYAIRLEFEAFDGCRLIKFSTKYPCHTLTLMKHYDLWLGSMYEQEQINILVRLSLRNLSQPNHHSLFRVGLTYVSALDRRCYSQNRLIKVYRGSSSEARRMGIELSIHPEVEKQLNRVLSAETIDEATLLAAQKEYEKACNLLKSTISRIKASKTADDPYCQDLVEDLTQCLSLLANPDKFIQSGVHQACQLSTMYYQERSVGVAVTTPRHDVNYGYCTPTQLSEKMRASEMVTNYMSNYTSGYDE